MLFLSTNPFFSSPGLLFNELRYAAHGILTPILRLVELALELDSGKFVSTTGPIILYVARLIVRIESYFLFMIEHYDWEKGKERLNGVMARSYVRFDFLSLLL